MLLLWQPMLTSGGDGYSPMFSFIFILFFASFFAWYTDWTKNKTLFFMILGPTAQGFVLVFTKWTALQSGYYCASFLLAGWLLWNSRFFETRLIGEWKAPDPSN